jgi:3-phosphoshikimate 1-carboxyvinyltransferase
MMSVGAAFLSYKGLSGNKRLVFQPKGKLIDRPLDQLIECLASHGVSVVIDKQAGTITESGMLTEGIFEIQGNISSQYISGLLMALVLLPNSSVKLLGALESKGYFELTVSTLESFGIRIDEENGLYTINNMTALSKNKNIAEGDWSSAAFLICLGALAKKSRIVLNGLNKKSIQKDKVIVKILSKLGIKTEWNGNSILLDMMSPNSAVQVDELELDASDYPDIVPYIAVVAAARAKLTKIKNVERLRFKECDRVDATIKALKAVGVNAEEQEGTLVIQRCAAATTPTNSDISIETFGDHRMAMTACLIAAWTGKTVYIDNKDCVNKSFPGLFELIEKGIKNGKYK